MTTYHRLGLLAAIALFTIAGMLLPRADDPRYQDFADKRWHNALNVWSNAAFFVAGAAGLIAVRRIGRPAEAWPLALFFLGNMATAVGSAYFHLHPDPIRLVWDRLPMTVAFAAFLGVFINERVQMGVGSWLTTPIALAGIWTVVHWNATQDLGPYSAFQLLAAAGTLFMLLFFPPMYDGDRFYIAGVVLYGIAKICEIHAVDYGLFNATGVSGHTLKHLFAAGTTAMVAMHVAHRASLMTPAR